MTKVSAARRKTAPRGRSNRTAAEAVVACLSRHGVELMVGQSIPTALYLAAPEFGIKQITVRTEHAGAIAADAYARISHKVAVVTAQNGPAATLLVPGLAEAYKASIPIVALVQDVARSTTDKNAFQELDHVDLFRACSKMVRRVGLSERVEEYVDLAFRTAASGRPGPVVLLLPFDLLQEPAAPSSGRSADLGRFPLDRVVADPDRLAEAAAMLAAAQRPLVVAGGGVHVSGAHEEVARLQDVAGLPVATTPMGKGAVDEKHPLSVGVVGYFMGTGGMAKFHRPLVDAADVVLFVGSRTNQSGTDGWTLFPPSARFIHIDIDGQEIGRNYEAVRLVGDAKLTLKALVDLLAGRDLSLRRRCREQVEAQIAAAHHAHRAEVAESLRSAARPIRPERLMADLDTLLTPDSIVVADASYASVWVANCLRARSPGMRFITPRGIAGIGWGLPMALGAKLAAPASPVFCVGGDGGFAHVWSELETVRRHAVNVVMIVLNNEALAYEKDFEDVVFGAHTPGCHFTPVDHAAIARACGCRGVRVEDPDDFLPALKEAAAAEEPTVIDVITDADARPPITMFEGKF